jgi:DNA-binding response OmpR family regulator
LFSFFNKDWKRKAIKYSASDGLKGSEVIQRENFDLILPDRMLPKMTV